jgi:hypothetical protein
MKTKCKVLIISILVSIGFTSCKQETIKTEEREIIQKFFLAADTAKGALSVNIHIEIPVAYTNEETLKNIRTTIITHLFGEQYVSYGNDSLVDVFAYELYKDYKANNESMVNEMSKDVSFLFNADHTLEGFSLLTDKHIYSYGIERYIFMGGAHGLNTRNYLNFNLKTGNLITKDDIFKENVEDQLIDLFKKRLIEQSFENEDIDPIKNLDATDFWIDSIHPNENFYITDESINYVFNPYEIGPYYLGITEIVLPFNRIKDILKPNSIINYLVEKPVKE